MYHGAHRKRKSESAVRRSRTRPILSILAVISLALATGAILTSNPSRSPATTYASPAVIPKADQVFISRARVYIVRPGDTLSRISLRFCGTGRDYPGLAAASHIPNPNVIRPGQRVYIRCSRSGPHRGSTAYVAVSSYQIHYSYSGLESLWRGAGGPSWAAPRAARIAICESGGYIYAHNPSGASGLWQILGLPFAGNPFNPFTNARMAVAKFRAAGNSFAPWVCR
jgi:hypothetical protein